MSSGVAVLFIICFSLKKGFFSSVPDIWDQIELHEKPLEPALTEDTKRFFLCSICNTMATLPAKKQKLCYSLRCFPCQCSNDCGSEECCSEYPTPTEVTGCMENDHYGVVRCPDSWQDDATRHACQNGVAAYTDDEPVSGRSEGVLISYRNRACAVCNGAHVHATWSLSATCRRFQTLYQAQSQDEFFAMAKSGNSSCKVEHVPPDGAPNPKCPRDRTPWFSEHMINECNLTGLWQKFDVVERALCLSLSGLRYRVYNKAPGLLFANVYCALCNGYAPRKEITCDSHIAQVDGGEELERPPLSLLFDFSNYDDEISLEGFQKCHNRMSWMTPNGNCRNLSCTPGKVWRNDTCITAVAPIRGLAYTLDLNFGHMPLSSHIFRDTLGREDFSAIRSEFGSLVAEKLKDVQVAEYNITLSIRFLTVSNTAAINVIGDITADAFVNRDDFENIFIDKFIYSPWNITVNANQTLLTPTAIMNQTLKTTNATINYELSCILSEYLEKPIPQDLKIKLTPKLTCPYLEFNSSEYEIESAENPGDTKVILLFGDVRLEVLDVRGAWLDDDDDGRLYVCQAALPSLSPAPPAVAEEPSWQYMLTVVMMSVSMVCLVLTLLTYSLLPALRTQPGLNTMGTCCALLLAQLSLLLASHRLLSGPACAALGVVVHMAWLSVFFWTSVCSVHMFRAFSAKTYHGAASHRRHHGMIRNVAVTLVVPALVVGLVMGISLATSGGASSGYSDVRCFLATPLLVGLSVVLPVSLLLLLNMTLFALTVYRINKVVKLQSQAKQEADSRRHVYICARLSVLTGATWILSILADGLQLDWLQPLTILANGGQGLLLFLSYVTTRRVASMLAARVGRRTLDPSSSSSSSRNKASTGVTTFSTAVTAPQEG